MRPEELQVVIVLFVELIVRHECLMSLGAKLAFLKDLVDKRDHRHLLLGRGSLVVLQKVLNHILCSHVDPHEGVGLALIREVALCMGHDHLSCLGDVGVGSAQIKQSDEELFPQIQSLLLLLRHLHLVVVHLRQWLLILHWLVGIKLLHFC